MKLFQVSRTFPWAGLFLIPAQLSGLAGQGQGKLTELHILGILVLGSRHKPTQLKGVPELIQNGQPESNSKLKRLFSPPDTLLGWAQLSFGTTVGLVHWICIRTKNGCQLIIQRWGRFQGWGRQKLCSDLYTPTRIELLINLSLEQPCSVTYILFTLRRYIKWYIPLNFMNPTLKISVLINCIVIFLLTVSFMMYCFREASYTRENHFITDKCVLTSLAEQTGAYLNHRPLGIPNPVSA